MVEGDRKSSVIESNENHKKVNNKKSRANQFNHQQHTSLKKKLKNGNYQQERENSLDRQFREDAEDSSFIRSVLLHQ